jgi:Sulfotransferase domain
MALEVIGAGFGRTGTMSLKVALETLGFGPCYHMTEVFTHPEHVELWRAAARGKPVDWEQVFGGYKATMDWPACTFYGELMEKYPDAKVILTVRDPQRWYESSYNTIYMITQAASSSPIFYLATLVMPRAKGMKRARRMIDEIVWQRDLDGRFEDRGYAIETFERHNEEVKRHVPSENLLVYEVGEGWGPLCEFLGVEVPDELFPHLNDSEVFRERIRRLRVLTSVALALGVSLVGLVQVRFRRHRRHRDAPGALGSLLCPADPKDPSKAP